MPQLEVNISTSGFTEVGLSFNMTCSVRVVEGLVEQPNVTWMKMDNVSMGDLDELNITTITVIEGSVTNVTLILDPVLFEHRGVYICMAHLNILLTFDVHSDSQEYELIVDCKLSLSSTLFSSSSFILISLFFFSFSIVTNTYTASLNLFIHFFCSSQLYCGNNQSYRTLSSQ